MNLSKVWALAFSVFFLTYGLSSNAKVFRNAYIAFEVPDQWDCKLDQTEWVCRSANDKERKEAIIILTAKEVGPSDSFPIYKAHLDQPKTSQAGVSKVEYPAKTYNINDHMWMDSLHSGSEVGNYFTRYMATIKDKIAILVTFSAHKTVYAKYSPDFIKAIDSLRVIATKNISARPDNGALRPGEGMFGANGVGAQIPMGDGSPNANGGNGSGSKGKKRMLLFGIIIVAAIGAYIVLSSKKKKK